MPHDDVHTSTVPWVDGVDSVDFSQLLAACALVPSDSLQLCCKINYNYPNSCHTDSTNFILSHVRFHSCDIDTAIPTVCPLVCDTHDIVTKRLNLSWKFLHQQRALKLQIIAKSGKNDPYRDTTCKYRTDKNSTNKSLYLVNQSHHVVSNDLERPLKVIFAIANLSITTRNILDCDQSNYSSRIILSHIPAKCIHLKFSKMTWGRLLDLVKPEV